MNKNSRINNSIINIFLGIGSQILVLLITFVTRIVFVRVLGAEYLGVNGLFSNVLTILSVAELGMGSAIIYSMYKPLSQNDTIKISALMNYYKKIYNIVAVVVLIMGITLIPFLKYLINTDMPMRNINVYYILILMNTVVSYLLASRTVILNADQKIYITRLYTLIVAIIQCILQVIFLTIFKNFILYLIIQVACTFLTNICGMIIVKKLYPYINKKDKLKKDDKKEIFTNMKSMFVYKVGGVIVNNTSNILISILVGTIWVGYYSNYVMVISSIETFTTIIFSALSSSVGNLIASTNKRKQFEIFKTINMICGIIFGFCSVGLAILLNDFINIFFGKEYVLEYNVVIVIIAYFYLKGILNPIWIYRETTGLFKQTKYIFIFTAIFNIIFSILLGKKFGMFGILLSPIISRLITSAWYEPYILFKEQFNRNIWQYFKSNIIHLLLTIIAIVISYVICSCFVKINMINFIIKGIIATFIVSGIYYISYRKSEEWKYIKENVLNKMLKKIHKNPKSYEKE